MGKIRRLRQKFHLMSSKNYSNNINNNVESNNKEIIGEPTLPAINISPNENVFAGIEIDVNQLQKSLLEDDRISVRSVAKSCKYDNKGKLLTKAMKRKLRHTLFLQKIDSIQQLAKISKKKNKFSVAHVTSLDPTSEKQYICTKIPSTQTKLETHDGTKIKGVRKTKQRQKLMLNDVAAFRRILHNPTFRSDPGGVVSEIVQRKVFEEI